ncbi:MAG: GH1 family beta-glucosidase [Halanaerobiales bacterium]
MKRTDFPDDFLWGTATASYQIEGAHNEDGKGESIWDRFTHTPGKIVKNYVGDTACDHYHRYREDVALMKEMGVNSYRFSIAWPRILPNGHGKVNRKGLDFYKSLISELHENEIKPAVTIYHWDLPQPLQFHGGWTNKDTVEYFLEYSNILFEELGDSVDKWITFNEPWCISFLSNQIGEHAPGIKDYQSALKVAHNLMVAHGKAMDLYREKGLNSDIGITLNLTPVEGMTDSEEDKEALLLMDCYRNRWFLDPVFKGEYPEELYHIYCDKFGDFTGGYEDISTARRDLDFLGINYYSRAVVRYDADDILKAKTVMPEGEYTDMGWEVYPDGLFDLLKRIDDDYGPLPLYITENGAAYQDELEDGRIHDTKRINYLKTHFQSAARAIEAGIPLKGYFIWTLMDNFEWAFGFSKRFGLLYTDYEDNLKRIWKDSAKWFRDFLKKE